MAIDFEMDAGTNKDITINVYEADGTTPADLTHATAVWACASAETIIQPPAVVFTKHSAVDGEIDIVALDVGDTPSQLLVHMVPEDTAGISGRFLQEARVTIGVTQQVVYSAEFIIKESITFGD